MKITNTLELVENQVRSILQNVDVAHDFAHTERVLKNACKIAECYPQSDIYLIKLASLLHDVDDYKLCLSNDSNTNAIQIMTDCKIDIKTQQIVTEIINSISYSHGKQAITIEAKIVQDADRLDAIGAIGIARTFSYGGKHDIPIYNNQEYCTVKHFYNKLLKLNDLLNLKESRIIAIERQKIMIEFLKHLENELVVYFDS